MSREATQLARAAARRFGGDLVLAAGAGTGKTHTLVDVFVHLVAGASSLGARVPSSRILALTFGEKAAAELRERVRSRFEALAVDPASDPGLLAEHAARELAPLTAAEWRAAAAVVAAAPIATFHSFAQAVLRRHAAGTGLDPAFTMLDETQAPALRRAAAEGAVLAVLDEPDVQALVRELDFSRGEDSRGSGLVEHMVAVTVRLDEEGTSAVDLVGRCDDANAATITHAAAVARWRGAYDGLIAALVGDGRKRPAGKAAEKLVWARSRHAAVHAALDVLHPALDPALEPTLAEARDELATGNYGVSEAKIGRDELKAAIGELAEAHASFRAAGLAATFVRVLGAAEVAYAKEKARLSALDFADLLRRARDLLRESAPARAETQARFDAVLVDEFQDTNPLQKQLLDLCRAAGVPRLVVGDPKQSIYEFRGADVTVFGNVERETAAQGGQVLALTESRRGRAPLVAFVNQLFARALRQSAAGHDFEIVFDQARDALAPVRTCAAADGAIGASVANVAGAIGASVSAADGAPAVLVLDAERDDEPGAVAALVRRFVVDRMPIWRPDPDDPSAPERPQPARWRDVAVLLRRFTRLDEYLRELRRAGVPHYVVGGRGFYEQQEVRDLCHALTLLDQPKDALALLGVLRSPLVGVSDRTLLVLAESMPVRANGRSGRLELEPLLRAEFEPPADVPTDEAARLTEYLALHRRLRRHADRLGVAGLLRALIGACDLPAVLAATPYGEQQIANLEQLVAQAAAHDDLSLPRAAFVRALQAQIDRERSLAAPAQVLGERDDVVRVMTVHQAKGLEFPIVFVPEAGVADRDQWPQVAYDRTAGLGVRLRNADGTLVSSRRAREALELRKARSRAESLRLFYVACTRARDHLIIAGCPTPRSKDTWRHHVDEWRQHDPDAAALACVVTEAPAPSAPLTASPAEREPAMAAGVALPAAALAADGAEAAAERLAERFAPPRTPARALVAPVTELSDFDDCARRYRLRHEVGLAEHRRLPVVQPAAAKRAKWGASTGGASTAAAVVASIDDLDPGALDPLERGTLAHRLLERVDFADFAARGAAALDDVLAHEGHAAPLADDAREVRDAVRRLLEAPLGRALAARAPATFAREESFVFTPRAHGAATRLLLKGQIDLVLYDDDVVTVLDYKLSRSTDGRDYHFQLGAYAAAARALYGRRVRAGLVHLRDRAPEPHLHDFGDAELDAIEARLADIAVQLAEARRLSSFPGRERPDCVALACGYIGRCHAAGANSPPPRKPPPTTPPGGSAPRRQLRFGEGIQGW